MLARLRHGCVVPVHRVFEARGTAYMVTEYVEGRNLAEALAAEGPWPQDRVLALLDALTSGLVRVHAAGLALSAVPPFGKSLQELHRDSAQQCRFSRVEDARLAS